MAQELISEMILKPYTVPLLSRFRRAELWYKTIPLTLELVIYYLKLQGIHDTVVSLQSVGLFGRHFKVNFSRNGWGISQRFSLRHFKKTLKARGVDLEGLYSCEISWSYPLHGAPVPGAWVGELHLKGRMPLRES